MQCRYCKTKEEPLMKDHHVTRGDRVYQYYKCRPCARERMKHVKKSLRPPLVLTSAKKPLAAPSDYTEPTINID